MIKYICIPTRQCNFYVCRVEVKQHVDPTNNVAYYTVMHTFHDCPQHTVGIMPRSRKPHEVFDTPQEAEQHAQNSFQDEKAKRILKIEQRLLKEQKRLDKMISHNPRIRRLNIAK